MHRRQGNNQNTGIRIMSLGNAIKIIVFFCLILQSITANASSDFNEEKNLIIEAVVCEGNKHTNSDFIKKELHLEKGDILDSDKIFDARLRLGAMPHFEDVHIYLRKGEYKGLVVIVINVKEGATIQSEISAGIGSWRGLINAKVTDYNFLGTSKILEGQVFASHYDDHYGGNYRLGLSYTDPQLFGTNKYFFSSSIMTGLLKRKYSAVNNFIENEDLQNEDLQKTDRDIISVGIVAGRRVARYSTVTIDVSAGNLKGSNFYYQTGPEDTRKDKDIIENNYYSIGMNYGWNTLDDTVFPTKGSVFDTGLHLALVDRSIYEDENYPSLNCNYSKYWALSIKSTINLSIGSTWELHKSSGEEGESFWFSGSWHCKYIRTIRKKEYNKKIINASWYVGTGYGNRYYSNYNLDGSIVLNPVRKEKIKQIQKLVAETGVSYRALNNTNSSNPEQFNNDGAFVSSGPRFKKIFDKLFEQYTNEDEEIGLWKTSFNSLPFKQEERVVE